jgi:hypothetical protein
LLTNMPAISATRSGAGEAPGAGRMPDALEGTVL